MEERELLERFVEAFLADDIDGMTALVAENAWFRMPPAPHEYHGPELIGAFLAAVARWRSPQPSRLIATRANGEPAFGTYPVDPASRLAQPVGLLVLPLAGAQIAELTWLLGPGYLDRFDPPSAPFVDAPVSKPPVIAKCRPSRQTPKGSHDCDDDRGARRRRRVRGRDALSRSH